MTPKTTGRVARAAALLAAAALTVTALASAAGAQTTTTAPADPPTATGSAESTAYDMAMLPASGYDCDRGESTILVADDMRAQSDVYAAVMLAEAVNGCLVYAGHRDMPMSDTQAGIARFAGGIDYVVGSEAAVSTAKLIQAGGTVATVRIGGTDRFHTARLVASRVQAIGYAEGVEDGAASAADDDMDGTDDDMDDADSDSPGEDGERVIGAVNGARTYNAPARISSVTATLGLGKWTVTTSTGSRVTTPFGPTIADAGACVLDTAAAMNDPKRDNRLIWETVEVKGDDCDAEDRTLTIELATNDLDEWDSASGTYDGVPDHAWTVRFEKKPIPTATLSRLTAPRTGEAAYTTAVSKIDVGADGMAMKSMQAIRLPRTGYWLVEATSAATTGANLNMPESGTVQIASAHMVKFDHFSALYGDNPRYDDKAYTCVALAGDLASENEAYVYQRGPMMGAAVDGLQQGQDSSMPHKRILHVPTGCSGYVAISIDEPHGESGSTNDDIMSWHLKVTQLEMKVPSGG